MRGCSLFSSAGISEVYFKELGIDIVVANELLRKRADFYSKLYPEVNMICGDIRDDTIFNKIIKSSGKVDFLIASPPCQGMSIAGKNRTLKQIQNDFRNKLIHRVVDFIKIKKPKFILIENVPTFLNLIVNDGSKTYNIIDFFHKIFGGTYKIESGVYDASDYGVPQVRKRAIVKLYKKKYTWKEQLKSKKITVKQSIGHLPSLNPGETSKLKWHFARKHTESHIKWMKHTPTGKTAFDNEIYYPQKKDGTRIKGYKSSYRRINWDQPSPTITIRNDAISSQRNVHPGRKKKDGTFSDPRVLTPLELMLLSSLPQNWKIPSDTPEILIRQCLGECIPAMMIKNIISPNF